MPQPNGDPVAGGPDGGRSADESPRRGALHDLELSYRRDLDPAERGAFTAWVAFTTTFVAVRGITHAIKDGRGPFHNVSVGGAHLHHYMWGIAGLSGIGAIAVRGETTAERHPAVPVAYGVSMALIVDEFALLLDLKDVYWQRQGRLSVNIGVTAIGTIGLFFSALPLGRRFLDRRRRHARR